MGRLILVAAAIGLASASPAVLAASGPALRSETPVTAENAPAKGANNSPSLAVSPRDSAFMAVAGRLDAPDFSCSLHLSGDGGGSWLPAQPMARLPHGAEKCYGPEVAFDDDGRLYFLFVGLSGRTNTPMGAFLTVSSDRGRSFSKPRKVLGPYSFFVRLAIDPESGRIHLVWLKASGQPGVGSMPPGPNPIVASYSDDGGRKFSKPVQVNPSSRDRVVAPSMAVGARGRLHVLYYDLLEDSRDYHGLEGPTWDGSWSLLLSTSDDRGAFSTKVLEKDVVPPERPMLIFTMPAPSLAASPDGALAAAWHDSRNGDWDVFLRRSLDGGKAWSKTLRVNREGRAHQYLPKISFSEDGRLDVIYYDRRNDPRNIRNDLYYAHSQDGSAFGEPVRLTSESSETRAGQQYIGPAARGRFDYGSRIALASGNSWAVAAWTDTRHVFAGETRQALVSRRIEFENAGSGSAGGLWGLGAGTLMALFVGILLRRRWARSRKDALRSLASSSARRRALTSSVALVLLAGCTPGYPPTAPEARVTMDEYRFSMKAPLSKGRVTFRFRNTGKLPHEAILIKVPAGLVGKLATHLKSPGPRRAVIPIARVPGRKPGQGGFFAVHLKPGNYAFVCVIRDEDKTTHAFKGMSREFAVV